MLAHAGAFSVEWANMAPARTVAIQDGTTMEPRTRFLPWHVTVRISVAANSDPKTVKRFCQGHNVRGRVAERIEMALNAAGIAVIDEHVARAACEEICAGRKTRPRSA